MRHALMLLVLLALPLQAAEPLRIAVAANFRATLEQINQAWTQSTEQPVVISSASTGVLTTQASRGAPYHLLLAADTAAPVHLHEAGVGKAPFCYAIGRLALVGGSPADLADDRHSVAIANPVTAPYGRAAQAVLARPNFSAGSERKLVRGNNVVQAYQFWHSGAVNMALVARSLTRGEGHDIPADWHQPIEQHALVLADHPAMAAYLAWLESDTVRSMILQAGYYACP